MLKNSEKKIKSQLKFSSVQLIVLFYGIAILVSTLLISLPIAQKPGVELTLIDAMFTAVSAISVTGLTVVPIADTFNVLGYLLLLFMFQLGGIGIMTLGTFIWLVMGKRIGLKERQLIRVDQNQSTLAGLVNLMKQILYLIIVIEFVGAFILGTYFLKFYETWQEAYLQGLFAAISATTNAGMDITGSSLVLFANDYFVQFINMTLIVLGAIGFPVLIEVKEYLSHKGNYPYHFSLFTKITTSTYFILVVVGALLIFLTEFNHFFSGRTWHESMFLSLFQSVSSRSAGLVTMDVNQFSDSTLLILSILMFIGASPSSVGGGIRTTSFAIMCLSIYFYAKGKNSIKVFKREIDPGDVTRAFVVITTALMICGAAVIGLSYLESFSILQLIFEVASAFGTCGLSMGITAELTTLGKLIICAVMFIGRIGIFSFLFLIRGPEKQEKFHYPKEKIIIG